MDSVMTIHYFKSSGDIYAAATGEQHISVMYGEHANDFMQILDEVILPYDDFVLRNTGQFKINTTTKEVILINADSVSKYL